MGVIKVETFDVNVTATASQTHTLTNDVGSLNSAFVRRTTSIDKQSGPVGNTGNVAPNLVSGAAFLSATNQISFRQATTTSQKIIGEVWRYTGAASGPDEFIVRGRYTITLNGTTTGSVATSGIVNVDDCIPFWNGSTNTNTSVNDYDASTVSVYIDASGNIQCERGSSTGTIVVYVTVVEFTGSNWSVGHVRSTNHDGRNDTDIPIRSNSIATTGTFDVGFWSNATLIEGSLEGDTSETGLSDNLGCWVPGSSTTTASFFNDQDNSTQNDGVAYAHILVHPLMVVNRTTNLNYTEGNNTYTTVPWPTGSSTSRNVDELSLEWYSDTSGVGTAHARGRLSGKILTSSTAEAWVHRSGNNVRVDYGVIELGDINGITPLTITDVDGDNILDNTQTGVIISGVEFGATQGSGSVVLTENVDGSGLNVSQNIVSWSDTAVTINFSANTLSDTNSFIRLTNDNGGIGVQAVQAGVPPIAYTTIIDNLSPDHYWTFDNNYLDSGVNGPNPISIQTGSPTFSALPLTNDKNFSFTISVNNQEVGPPNSNWINAQAETTRTMGGWIRITQIQDSFVMFYEEGGSVNNIAFLMGIGGILIAQLADTGDDNVHAYSDFPLEPNRNYHILFRFDYNDTTPLFELFVDGINQSTSFGNPLGSPDLDAHTGDIVFGGSSDNLEVFGTDISFPAAVTTYYQDWASWTVKLTDTEIREDLFELGVIGDIIMTGDTEALVQAQIDAISGTTRDNSDCSIKINVIEGDATLRFTDVVFNQGTSIQIQYLGISTLTLISEGSTNFDVNKLSAPNGGSFIIVEAVPVKVTVRDINTNDLVEGSRVRVTAASGGTETIGTVLLEGISDSNGVVETTFLYNSDQPIIGLVRKGTVSPYYKQANIINTITATGLDITILLIPDE